MPSLSHHEANALVAIPPAVRHIPLGERIHAADSSGIAWRIQAGAVRLDRIGHEPQGSHAHAPHEVRHFAGLALKGDVIGAETLLFGRYAFEARAIDACILEPWLAPHSQPSGETLLQTLAAAERRAADALALRYGEALERVQRLFRLLARESRAGHAATLTIPGLKDMAEMTGLTVETVSRSISRLKKSGLLEKRGRRAGLLTADALSL